MSRLLSDLLFTVGVVAGLACAVGAFTLATQFVAGFLEPRRPL